MTIIYLKYEGISEAVSTPAHFYEFPNLDPLLEATKQLGQVIKKGDIIVFESSVYPGTTDELCIPILETVSQLSSGKDFNVGYSPERIFPGDKVYTLKTIPKVISAQNDATLLEIKETYEQICDTTYPIRSIQMAEAVKMLENAQRDVNIAFMNEFSKIMHAMDLNVHEIIEAAKTKWSFVPFKPGLVGGHCISIDPNYLAFRAKQFGIFPDLIVAARKVNDGITQFIIHEMLRMLIKHHIDTQNMTVGVFGVSYKENSVDTRNSLAFKLLKELREYGIPYRVHDPLEQGVCIKGNQEINLEHFDDIHDLTVAIVLVGHDYYHKIGLQEMINKCGPTTFIMDIPNLYIQDYHSYKNLIYWSL